MTNKHCLVYETLGKVSNLQVCESAPKDMMRLTGVFGVCGVKNQNNRIYDKENYRQMVESLQAIIKESGCPGELEHPNSMNINLENVSHKIEDIQMNEDGTVTGTILLLNTPKGQIAQAIVEGGLPLYISSRGAGTITNEGRVTLSTIKTYDLVGTPGFSQAKLTLKENQTLECLNESAEDGNVVYAIVEGDDDLLGGDDDEDKKKKDKKDDDSSDDLLGGGDDDNKSEDDSDKEEKSDDSDEKKDDKEDKSDDEKKEDKKSDKKKEDKDNKNNKDTVKMNDLKDAIDKLTDKVTSLEAELHIAKESLEELEARKPETVNYSAVENWITEEAMPKFKEALLDDLNTEIAVKVDESIETISTAVQNWICEEFAPEVQNWVCEEFAPEVQNWIVEEYSPEVQNWITEEYSPEVQGWITEEFAPEVQNWITEEFAPVVDGWINEEFAPEHMQQIEEKVNENVSAFMESHKAGRLDEIDSLLETLSDNSGKELETIVKEQKDTDKFSGVYVVENMPAEYRPSWALLNEEQQNDIVRRSKMYDFTKEGVLESFWANVDFNAKKEDVKPVNEGLNAFHNNIAKQMQYLRNRVK